MTSELAHGHFPSNRVAICSKNALTKSWCYDAEWIRTHTSQIQILNYIDIHLLVAPSLYIIRGNYQINSLSVKKFVLKQTILKCTLDIRTNHLKNSFHFKCCGKFHFWALPFFQNSVFWPKISKNGISHNFWNGKNVLND